ncbi:hypothetical protein VFPPC_13547 [Pochonia chlamydosporia 170]|uniref:Uncharacterized protein n=1 Tax=Pochonia chlamydosporia 170 TaxID=1380566 RepID=A0A179F2Y9_METCM|nr:hypothetical protein VFPPC_13547 [Pochonia chlamydosporia 170]OAQ59721.1 hypothetical protein VFPPC_13547 [Pochonia chlamydosporia 170]
MHISTLFVSAFAASALANPVGTESKRDTRHVYITTDRNWGGQNQNLEVENNVRYEWNDKVRWANGLAGPGSLGPDNGVCCILYDQNNPEVPSSTICNPGDSDLTGYWQFHTYHFKCWW